MKNTIITSFLFLLFVLCACSGRNASVENQNTFVEKTTSSSSADEKQSKKEALIYLFNQIYTDQSDMSGIEQIDSEDFFGYEYKFNTNGETSNPWRLGYYKETDDQMYYIFRLYECVYYEDVLDHEVTSNFYAVNQRTKEIITERLYPDDGGAYEWNEEFPQ
jgi:hypothetical protein